MNTPDFWNGALFGCVSTFLISGLFLLVALMRAQASTADDDGPDWGAGQ